MFSRETISNFGQVMGGIGILGIAFQIAVLMSLPTMLFAMSLTAAGFVLLWLGQPLQG